MNDFFDLLNGFRINGDFPIDSRFVVADEAARLAIPVNAVYKGLFTFQADVNLLYIYDGEDQTNVDSAWTSFTVNNIDVANVSFEIAPNGNTIVTLPFENGQQTQFVVQRGEAGPEAQYFIEVIGEFAEDIVVPAPQGGSYDTETRVLDTTGLTAGWFDPFTQQVPALADGNAYYRARFIIIPARITGSVTPTWSSPVQLSGDQGPQGQTGPNGPDGIDGDSFFDVVQTVVPTRGMFTNVQPRKQDHNGLITNAGDPIRLAAGFTGASVTDVVNITGGDQAGVPTTFQLQSTAENGATTILPQTVTIQPGASGSGSGDVNSTGTIIAGQYAKFNNPTLISGQTGVPGSDITGLSTNGNTDLSTILNDLDSRDVGVADVKVQSQDIVLINGNGAEVGTGFRLLNAVTAGQATPVQSDALFTEFGTKLDTDLTNVASLTTQQQSDFRTAIGAGTGHGGSNITVSATAGVTDTDTNVTYDADDKVDLSPTANQRITQPSGTVLDVRGSFDLETNSGEKALDFSGTSGDIHLEDFNTTTNESNTKVLFDRSSGQLYMNPTSTTLNLPTSDDNKVMRAGGLAIGATSVGHADHSDNNEEAIIEIGYENVEVSTLPLNVETADADAAETFIKRNTNGEIIFSLSNVIQSGDLRPATSAAVNTAISNSGSFNPGGTNTDGFVLTNDGTGAYNWEAATGTSNITVATTGVTDNNPGGVTYNASDKQVDLGLTQDANGDVIVDDKDIILEHTAEIHFHGNGVNPVDEAIIDYNTTTNTLEIIPAVHRNVALEVSGTGKAYVGPPGVAANEIVTVGTQTGGGGNATVRVIQPTGVFLQILPTYDITGGGGSSAGEWYIRENQDTNTDVEATSWSDWVVENGTDATRHQIFFDTFADADENPQSNDSNAVIMANAAVAQGYVFVQTDTGSAIVGVTRFSGTTSNDWRLDISSIINSIGVPGTSGALRISNLGFASVGNDDKVPNGIGNGHMLVWDNNLGIWREVSILVDGLDDDGDDEVQSFGLNSIAEGVERRVTTREWQEAHFATLGSPGGNTFTSGINVTGNVAGGQRNDAFINVISTDDTAVEAPDINLFRDSTSPAADDELGAIYFHGNTDVPSAFPYAYGIMYGRIDDPSNADPKGEIHFNIDAGFADSDTDTTGGTVNETSQLVIDADGINVRGNIRLNNSPFTGGADSRFTGTPLGLDHSDTGVTVGASIDYNDPSTDAPYTIILPSANTYTFAVGQGVSATDAGTTYTIVRLQPTSTVTEFYISGHHASEFPAGTSLFVSEDGHKQNSIWTLPTQGAPAYTQDDNVLNDILSKEASLTEQVQANSTAIAAFQADLVSIAAYQPQGAYLSGAGDITPSYSTDQVDRSGSKTGTGYANTGAIRVYHNGDFEVLTYLLMPEGTNTDGTGTNAPDVDYVSAFEEQFKTEDIIGHALVSGAYNTQGFPHVMNTTLETSYDNGYGTGLKAYFLNGIYQGRVEVRFQGTLTPSQNSDRTFITDHSDRTILYDNYTSYQIFPTNAFWHNVRIADPEQIFLIKEGVYLLHEIADAAVPANVGKVLSVEQDQNRVDTFNFPSGSNLSGDLSFTLSRPPNGTVTFSTVAGATITNTGSPCYI